MSRRQRHDNDASAPAAHLRRADDGVFRIISALHDDVRLEVFDEIERRILGENYHQVDALQGGENERPIGVGADRPGRTLESPHRFVAIDSHDESIGGLPRSGENIDVAGMNDVEDTIGERDAVFPSRAPIRSLSPRCNLGRWISRLQSLLSADGWKWMMRCFLNGSEITSS